MARRKEAVEMAVLAMAAALFFASDARRFAGKKAYFTVLVAIRMEPFLKPVWSRTRQAISMVRRIKAAI
jgi:hypothetical protein